MSVVKCPTCGKTVEWIKEQRWKPFCSERCKLIDLGTWAGEGYRIPERAGKETAGEQDTEDLPVNDSENEP